MRSFDAIVIGLGAMGSAVAYNLAKRGVKVLALEKYSMNHTNGSSHGKTRIIRTAYFEHPSYVPLVQRAFELWCELQAEAQTNLIKMTGGLMIGQPESELLSGTIRSARQHGLRHEILDLKEIAKRFPAFHPQENEIAVYEEKAGILFPEECVKAQDMLAQGLGAELHFKEPAVRWVAEGDLVHVRTAAETYVANHAVIAVGPWMSQLLSELNLPLRSERQTLHWFRPVENETFFAPEQMPIFLWSTKDGSYFYGFPDLGDGVKIAKHHGGEITSPDTVRRQVTEADETPVRQFLQQRMPSANGMQLPQRHAYTRIRPMSTS